MPGRDPAAGLGRKPLLSAQQATHARKLIEQGKKSGACSKIAQGIAANALQNIKTRGEAPMNDDGVDPDPVDAAETVCRAWLYYRVNGSTPYVVRLEYPRQLAFFELFFEKVIIMR
jgi:hypothetical protein